MKPLQRTSQVLWANYRWRHRSYEHTTDDVTCLTYSRNSYYERIDLLTQTVTDGARGQSVLRHQKVG